LALSRLICPRSACCSRPLPRQHASLPDHRKWPRTTDCAPDARFRLTEFALEKTLYCASGRSSLCVATATARTLPAVRERGDCGKKRIELSRGPPARAMGIASVLSPRDACPSAVAISGQRASRSTRGLRHGSRAMKAWRLCPVGQCGVRWGRHNRCVLTRILSYWGIECFKMLAGSMVCRQRCAVRCKSQLSGSVPGRRGI